MSQEIDWNGYHLLNKDLQEAAKPAIAALVVLNSGAWLALLTHIDAVIESSAKGLFAWTSVCWGAGAAVGVMVWLCAYFSMRSWALTKTLQKEKYAKRVDLWAYFGVGLAAVSLLLFMLGVALVGTAIAFSGSPDMVVPT